MSAPSFSIVTGWVVGRGEAEHATIEVQFGLERPLDVLRPAESVLLPRVCEVR